MPGGDRTGPMGQGAMTGRRAGYCTGSKAPGYMNPVPGGRGFGGVWGGGFAGSGRGGGRGGGRGWRHWYHATGQPGWMRFGGGDPAGATNDPEQQRRDLEEHARFLENELEQVKKRLVEAES